METLNDDLRIIHAQIAHQRACRDAAEAAARLLSHLDDQNDVEFIEHRGQLVRIRHLSPATETAMCELRAKLAEVAP